RFDINVEYQGAILDDDMVVRGGFPNDGISGLTAGVTFRFGKTGFKKGYSSRQYNAIKSNYSDLEANYATLKKENAAQQAEIAELKARKPEIVKEETVIDNSEIKALPSTITFPFNSSKIELSQEVSIFNIAEFLKANPEIRVRLTGYADKRGSEQANRIVSERRANAVTEVFVNKYGIAKDRITTEFKGTSTKFENDDWNRAVVVELIK
ncbi:OmpA family protein, partial [Bacteroides fragilis]